MLSSLVFLAACGGGDKSSSNSSTPGSVTSSKPKPTSVSKADVSPKNLDAKGVGPISAYDPGSIDEAKVASGQQLFTTNCTMCHKMEERLLGPPLKGVTERRSPEWILNMILAPENMIENDADAKALYKVYNTPMINQHLSEDQAKAILDYLRKQDN